MSVDVHHVCPADDCCNSDERWLRSVRRKTLATAYRPDQLRLASLDSLIESKQVDKEEAGSDLRDTDILVISAIMDGERTSGVSTLGMLRPELRDIIRGLSPEGMRLGGTIIHEVWRWRQETDSRLPLPEREVIHRLATGKEKEVKKSGTETPASKLVYKEVVVKQKDDDIVGSEVLATAIRNLGLAVRAMDKSGLSERAIVVLLSDVSGVSKTDIRTILHGLRSLEKTYLK